MIALLLLVFIMLAPVTQSCYFASCGFCTPPLYGTTSHLLKRYDSSCPAGVQYLCACCQQITKPLPTTCPPNFVLYHGGQLTANNPGPFTTSNVNQCCYPVNASPTLKPTMQPTLHPTNPPLTKNAKDEGEVTHQ